MAFKPVRLISPLVAFLCGLLLIAVGVASHALRWQAPTAPVGGAASVEKAERPAAPSQRKVVATVPAPPPGAGAMLPQAEPQAVRGIADAEKALLDRLTQGMQSASYAFNHPRVLYLGRRAQITLALGASESTALQALRGQFEKAVDGTVRLGTTKYAPVMIATLRGRAFRIEPSGEQAKMVFLNASGPMEWTWFVEPLETGKGKLLLLELAASIEQGKGRVPIRIKTFEARIDVDVRAWDFLLSEARRMTPISQALTGAGGFIALLGFLGTGLRWLRRTRKPAAPTVS